MRRLRRIRRQRGGQSGAAANRTQRQPTGRERRSHLSWVVVLVPLAAVVFYSLGRHPLAGLAAAFAGVSGGYSANLLIGTVDPLLSGITTRPRA